MQLNIKNPEACDLAHKLAAITGESLTTVVTSALRDKLESLTPTAQLAQELLEIARACSSRLTPEQRSVDHGAFLYDEMGMPK